MSAWIEITRARSRESSHAVALLVSAWIEIVVVFKAENVTFAVALLVSAWIEMMNGKQTLWMRMVALLVSAWIEISNATSHRPTPLSHSS